MVITRDWWERDRQLLINEYSFIFARQKEFWRLVVVIIAQKYECLLISLNCTFKNG